MTPRDQKVFWYDRRAGLWAIGLSIALSSWLLGYLIDHVGGKNGAVITGVGILFLSWAVPLAIAKDTRRRLHPRPEPLGPSGRVEWDRSKQAWFTRWDGHYWWYEAEGHVWRRGAAVEILYATTADARNAAVLRKLDEQNRLIAEQNRLLTGLPPSSSPRQVNVIPAKGPPPRKPTS